MGRRGLENFLHVQEQSFHADLLYRDDQGFHFLNLDDYTQFCIPEHSVDPGIFEGGTTCSVLLHENGEATVTAVTASPCAEGYCSTATILDFGPENDDEPPEGAGSTADLSPPPPPISGGMAIEPENEDA